MKSAAAWIVYLLIPVSVAVDWLFEDLGIVPHLATFSIEGAIFGLLVAGLLTRRRWVFQPTDAPVAAVVLLAVGTAFARGEEPFQILLGLRALFRFLALFYALVLLDLPARVWRNAVLLLLGCLLVQVPIAFYQFEFMGRTDDQVFGSTRSTGVLTLVTIAATMVMAGMSSRPGSSLWPLLLAAAFVILPGMGEAKAFFILFPLAGFLTVLVLLRTETLRRTAGVAAALGLIFAGSMVHFSRVDGNADLLAAIPRVGEIAVRAVSIGDGPSIFRTLRGAADADTPAPVVRVQDLPESVRTTASPRTDAETESARRVERRREPALEARALPLALPDRDGRNPVDVTVAASMWPRLQAVGDAWGRIAASPSTMLTGFGIGTRTFTREQVKAGSSTLFYPSPAATRLYELGVVGAGLFWLTFAVLLVRWWPMRGEGTWLLRGVIVAFPGIVAVYLLSEFYTEILSDVAGFTFWFLAAAMVSRMGQPTAPAPRAAQGPPRYAGA